MNERYQDQHFALANRAFDLFTLAQRTEALEHVARLRYDSVTDRFCEAVYRVICSHDAKADPSVLPARPSGGA